MGVTYKKLWKRLIDNNMKKKDLQHAAELTNYATTDVLAKICIALNCSVDDIMDILPEKSL